LTYTPERPLGFSKQIIDSTKWAPSETGSIPTAGISVGRTQYVNFMSVKGMGQQWPMDDELLGNRNVPRQWPELGDLPWDHPHARSGQHR
jgi:hypothetical protein